MSCAEPSLHGCVPIASVSSHEFPWVPKFTAYFFPSLALSGLGGGAGGYNATRNSALNRKYSNVEILNFGV